MKKIDFKILTIIALMYWIPSGYVLINALKVSSGFFPDWLNTILFPGWFLGFVLGFEKGNFWALIGHFFTLIVLFFLTRIIYELFRKIKKSTKAQQYTK